MSQTQTLFPVNALNMSISLTATASSSTALPVAGGSIHIFNEGPNNAWVSVGTGAQVATLPSGTPAATCFPVPAGAVVVYSIPEDIPSTGTPTPLNISGICRATCTAVLNVAVNQGC